MMQWVTIFIRYHIIKTNHEEPEIIYLKESMTPGEEAYHPLLVSFQPYGFLLGHESFSLVLPLFSPYTCAG